MTEFDDVIQLLKDERPQATELELDAIKQRVRRNAANPSRRSQSMKSRFAILAMLVTGMLFSTAGAGLALSGNGSNASLSQYAECTPTPAPNTTPGGTVGPAGQQGSGDVCEEGGVLPAGEQSTPTPRTNSGNESEEGGVLPASESQTQPQTQPATQAERQQAAAAETSQLPFTGFAAIPVLLGGLALLSGGLVLRRRTRSE
jgi:hypothetical protein